MIITLTFLFRILSLFLFFLWWMYWRITERDTERKRPKTEIDEKRLRNQRICHLVLRIAEGIMILQVIGLRLLPLRNPSFILQVSGFVLVVIGFSIAVSARKTLGVNWAHAFEYQIKQKQELVTNGIYVYIRHPIYTGLCLAFIGGELIAQSYLVFVGLFLFAGGYWQARQEEKLLVKHFGNEYKAYMKHTKMFIPFLW